MKRFARRRYYQRQYLKRFLQPIDRLQLSPEGVGRTVFVGLIWGLNALFGTHLIGVTLTWLLLAKWLGRPFNLPVALLLTGVSNPLTVTPLYSLYFVTGCSLLPSCHHGRHGVRALIAQIHEAGLWQAVTEAGHIFVAILIGSVPFTLAGAIGGYYFGRYVGERLNRRRRSRTRRPAGPAPEA